MASTADRDESATAGSELAARLNTRVMGIETEYGISALAPGSHAVPTGFGNAFVEDELHPMQLSNHVVKAYGASAPGQPAAQHRARHEADKCDDGGSHVDARLRDEPEAEENDVAGHVRDEHVAEHQHADRVNQTGRKGQQQQAGDRQAFGDRGFDGHGLGFPIYSRGVRSSDVTVDIRVISHFASRRSIVSRYDR
mgnify:CR=1 FL=1